jgi:hypothetical protein
MRAAMKFRVSSLSHLSLIRYIIYDDAIITLYYITRIHATEIIYMTYCLLRLVATEYIATPHSHHHTG